MNYTLFDLELNCDCLSYTFWSQKSLLTYHKSLTEEKLCHLIIFNNLKGHIA